MLKICVLFYYQILHVLDFIGIYKIVSFAFYFTMFHFTTQGPVVSLTSPDKWGPSVMEKLNFIPQK